MYMYMTLQTNRCHILFLTCVINHVPVCTVIVLTKVANFYFTMKKIKSKFYHAVIIIKIIKTDATILSLKN